MNDNEMHIAQRYIDEGWTLIRGGSPDFLFVKSEDNKITDVLFVEVKTPTDFLSFEQATYRRVIEEFLKAKYKLEVVTNEFFSSQNEPIQPTPDQTNLVHTKPSQNKNIPFQTKTSQANPDHTTSGQSRPTHTTPFQTDLIYYGDLK